MAEPEEYAGMLKISETLDSIAPMAREAMIEHVNEICDTGDQFQLSPEQILCLIAFVAGGIAVTNCDPADEETINARLHFFDDAAHTFAAMTRVKLGLTPEQIEEIMERKKTAEEARDG